MRVNLMCPAATFIYTAAVSMVRLFEDVEALSGGAPSMACTSMTPYHFAFQPQPLDGCPFTVYQSKLHYRPENDTVTVTLTVKNGNPRRTFRGFLIKAINPLTKHAIGQFREQFDIGVRRNCHAATHMSPGNKARIVLHWIPEEVDEQGHLVVFEATFVETFRKFFVGVQSTLQGRPAVDIVKKEKEEELHDHGMQMEKLTTNNKTKASVLKEVDVEDIDRRDYKNKPHKTTNNENTFWF
ncbi:hypothetical protein BIW11_05712 [Tropilaelaps mercedesae]|uniref:Reelin domain-containing protein n=1 Tax=Tropilaelaps mercedesae TaxID=418985 RepID=A0A1V9Y1A2_9ACAR|nr:hypothetical protein BIW11_05712 [Tropilaelaps mercedesae]